MKIILHTKEGFEKIMEVKDFTPIIRIPITPTPKVFQKESDYTSEIPVKEFLMDREEKILHYKEL